MRVFERKRQRSTAHGYRLLDRGAKSVDQHASIGRRQGQIAPQTIQCYRTVGHHRHTGGPQSIARKNHRQIDLADRNTVTSSADSNHRITGRDDKAFTRSGFLTLDAKITLNARKTINRHCPIGGDCQIWTIRGERDRATGINRHSVNARDRQSPQNRARSATVAVDPQLTIPLR